jgi:uncharacterized membrane protein
MFSIFKKKKKQFFTPAEEKQIMAAIKTSEGSSSGEIRVFVESNCVGTVEKRTVEVFKKLKMHLTHERNAVLVYLATDSRHFAVFGDEGIHQKMGFQFWTNEAATFKSALAKGDIIGGICDVILDIGQTLKTHFPHPPQKKNELPDKPVYGD